MGWYALSSDTTGPGNTAIGYYTLASNTTGDGNTALGYNSGGNVVTADSVLCIGAGAGGADVSSTTWIANAYGIATLNGSTAPVIVSADGQLGTIVSSERFKKDIATMDKASDAILSLRPVTFHYKSDVNDFPQFGLIAEEVAKVNPALVLPDKEGKPYTVRYDAVNAMLLNEFLKEHRKVEDLKKDFQATVAQLTARLREQAAQIQKVSAQLEASKPAPQVVNNP
ncbi:MAG: tail fiber domain-containing protein [Candidatus Udaeobacter sp.]